MNKISSTESGVLSVPPIPIPSTPYNGRTENTNELQEDGVHIDKYPSGDVRPKRYK